MAPGTTWTNSDGLVVGGGGTGKLILANGGAVSNTFSYIGIYSNFDVYLHRGERQRVNLDQQRYSLVGYHGTGALKITNGGDIAEQYQ